jgi:thiamine-phosphate pyrophosphorylase
MDAADKQRLILVVPADAGAEEFSRLLETALSGADVAAALMQPTAAAEALVPVVQQAGAAALVVDDTRLAGRLKADGVHVARGPQDIRMAVDSFRPKRIVGAGGLTTRHAAMEAGEIGVD